MPLKFTKLSFLLRCIAVSVFLCTIFHFFGFTLARAEYKADHIESDGPLVELNGLGKLIGSLTYGRWTNKTIYQFLGVRYAKSPMVTGRFKVSHTQRHRLAYYSIVFFYVWIFQPPVAEEPWHGTRLAQNYGRLCPQLDDLSKLTAEQRYEQDLEDCLHLSVYSGDVSTSEAFVWCLELVCCVFLFADETNESGRCDGLHPRRWFLRGWLIVVSTELPAGRGHCSSGAAISSRCVG